MSLGAMRRVAVVAPHPDDEILGCGGTIARLVAEGAEVHVVVATRGQAPDFDESFVGQVREETHAAHALLGIARTHFLDLPAAALDTIRSSVVNRAVGDALSEIAPDTLFVPFVGDIHIDHRIVFDAAMVHARPRSADGVATVLAYETMSETNWWAPGITPGFLPNHYVDIAATLETKLAAFGLFASQVKPFPDERSIDAIRALALFRGATVHRAAAEAFMTVRVIA